MHCVGKPCQTKPIGGLYGHGLHATLDCFVETAVIKNLTFGTSVTNPHMLQYIQINCENIDTIGGSPHQYPAILRLPVPSGANRSDIYDYSKKDLSNFTLTSLSSDDGFSTVSVYTSDKPGINPITRLSVGTLDSQNISAGEVDSTVTGDPTQEFTFDLPNKARVYGLDLYYSTFVNSISVIYFNPALYEPYGGISLPSFAPISG